MSAIDYSLLPAHCRGAMRRYIENGIPPGSFLTAVLTNDLVGTFRTADEINHGAIEQYVKFLYWEAPSPCHGSPFLVDQWQRKGGLNGSRRRAGE